MRFNIFYEKLVGDSFEHPNIFDGEASSLHTRGNHIKWVSYCIVNVVQICMAEPCTIDKVDADGTIWLTSK